MPTTLDALRVLASVCDGAYERDGNGFNATDTHTGRRWAQWPALTPGQDYVAHRMLRKYRSQLAGLGIDYDAIPAPRKPEGHTNGLVTGNGTIFEIRFDYDPRLVDAVKALPGRRWHREKRCWTVPATNHNEVMAWAAAQAFAVDETAGALAERVKSAPPAKPSPAPPPPSGTLRLDGKHLIIEAPYDPAFVEACRRLPGRRWHRASATHRLPLRDDALHAAIALADTFGLSVAPEVTQAAVNMRQAKERAIAESTADGADIAVDGLGGELRPFQRAAVKYALRAERCFIADEMGLGKTIEALATLQAADAFPALIVCPASLKLNWEREATKWLPARSVAVLSGRARAALGDIVVINYDILARNKAILIARDFEAIVFDESHYAKNHRAKRTEACKAVAKGTRIRLALTGTPILNRPQELLSQLGILGRLEDLGGFWTFAQRYCRAHRSRYGWDLSGADNLGELNQTLRSICLVRRLKSDVLAELPAKQRATITLPLTNRAAYDRAKADVVSWIGERAADDAAFKAEIRDLPADEQRARRRARATTAAHRAREAEQLVRIEALKQLAADGKGAAAQDWIASFLESGEKLVLFAHHKEVVRTFAEAFDAPSITGDTPPADRQAAVDAFQNDDACRMIVCNIQAGGVGITLTAASNVAFVELGWNPGTMDQAEDRCHRIGQENAVTAWYLLGEETIDIDIAELIDQKRHVVDRATNGGEGGATTGILNSLVARLSPAGTASEETA